MLRPLTVALALLICSTASAQKDPRIVSLDELRGDLPSRIDMHGKREIMARSTVRIRVEPPRSRYIRPIEDVSAFGIATLVQLGDAPPVLITSEFLVRGREEVELILPDGTVKAAVERAELNHGLALIAVPETLAKTLTPLQLLEKDPQPTERLFTLAHDATGNALAYSAILGPQGDGALAWYRTATPAFASGAPLITDNNGFAGLYTFRAADRPDVGLVITASKIGLFLAPKEESVKVVPWEMESLGGGKPRP